MGETYTRRWERWNRAPVKGTAPAGTTINLSQLNTGRRIAVELELVSTAVRRVY